MTLPLKQPLRYVVKGPFDQASGEYRFGHLWAYDARDAITQGELVFWHFELNCKRAVPGTVTNVEPWDEKIHGQWIGKTR